MDDSVQRLVEEMIGKPCCRQRVWRMRSLSLGFGARVFHENERLVDPYYGEWEIVTYHGGWRVVDGARTQILCGSQDAVDSIEELHMALNRIEMGRVVAVRHLTDLDLRVELDNRIAVDFLGIVGDDECFHIRCPGNILAKFTAGEGWKVGPSDRPWKQANC